MKEIAALLFEFGWVCVIHEVVKMAVHCFDRKSTMGYISPYWLQVYLNIRCLENGFCENRIGSFDFGGLAGALGFIDIID